MTITFRQDESANYSNSPICNLPVTGLAAGDLFVAFVAHKYPATNPTTPSGWTKVGDTYAGAGASGSDSGEVRACAYIKEAAGTESGTQTFTIGGNSGEGVIVRYRKTAGTWNAQAVYGADTALGSSWSVTATDDAYMQTGGVLIAFSAVNGNLVDLTPATLTASGVTLGTMTSRKNMTTSFGDDMSGDVFDAAISSGDAWATPAMTATHSGASGNTPAGPVLFLILTEDAPPAGAPPSSANNRRNLLGIG